MEKRLFLAELRAIAVLMEESQKLHEGGHFEAHEVAKSALKRVLKMIDIVEEMA